MELSKIIRKVIFESEGVEEFYEVEEYMSDTTFSQELRKISKVLKPFIQRVAPESMYIIERNRKEIMNTIFEFIDTYLINDGLGDTKIFDVETILSKGQDYYPLEFTVENKYRFMMFLLNLFSNYLKDYEGGDLRNQRILKRNKELIRIDLIHFIQLHLDFSKDDEINENKKEMNVELTIRKVLFEEFSFKTRINENITIRETLKSFENINIDSLQNLTTRLIGLYKRDGIIEEKDFLKVKAMVDMIYASIDGETGPEKYQLILDKAQEYNLDELVKNLSSVVLRLVSSVKGFYQEIKSHNLKEAEKKLFSDINPISKMVMMYLDMIEDKSQTESDDTVSESIFSKDDEINESFNSKKYLSESMTYHLDNNVSLIENIFRPFSKEFFNLINEARELYNEGEIEVSDEERWLVESDFGKKVRLANGLVVRLEVPYVTEHINEAEYKGRKVELGKPMRNSGGGKKYVVYVKNPSTGKVKKISFGDVHGGLTAKVSNPKARKAFASRHNCKTKKDRMTAGYWACRINRYGHLWGGKTYGGYW